MGGRGFAHQGREKELEAALKLNGTDFEGRELKVERVVDEPGQKPTVQKPAALDPATKDSKDKNTDSARKKAKVEPVVEAKAKAKVEPVKKKKLELVDSDGEEFSKDAIVA